MLNINFFYWGTLSADLGVRFFPWNVKVKRGTFRPYALMNGTFWSYGSVLRPVENVVD
jgi:hypothetical protein